jgi:CTP-dependent riboflavin kinase
MAVKEIVYEDLEKLLADDNKVKLAGKVLSYRGENRYS